MVKTLKQAEEFLEGVDVRGEENWRRMTAARSAVREVRKALERIEADARKKKEEKINEAEDDAIQQREPENGTGAV